MGSARGASRRVCHVRIAFATGKEVGKSGGCYSRQAGGLKDFGKMDNQLEFLSCFTVIA